jgi:hypothetical protein
MRFSAKDEGGMASIGVLGADGGGLPRRSRASSVAMVLMSVGEGEEGCGVGEPTDVVCRQRKLDVG